MYLPHTFGRWGVSLLSFVILTGTFVALAQDNTVKQRSSEQDTAEDDDPPPPGTTYYRVVFDGNQPRIEDALSSEPSEASADRVTTTTAYVVTIASEVTTEGTAYDCTRDSKTSDWSEITVPDGYVYKTLTLSKDMYSDAGTDNRIDHEFDHYVEIVPGTGIMMPRTLRVRTHARSAECNYPGHNRGARGWTKARVTCEYVGYQG